jgi:hypothetical protein
MKKNRSQKSRASVPLRIWKAASDFMKVFQKASSSQIY